MSFRATVLVLALACIAVALVGLRPQTTPGPLLRDFESYYCAGQTWAAGKNPYGLAIWSAERRIAGVDARRDEVLPFVGPPQTLRWWALLGRLPYPAAAILWSVCLGIAALTLVLSALSGAGAALRAPQTLLAALALAVGFGPITSALALGQVALLALAGATLAAAQAASPIVAACGCVLAGFQPNVALALVTQVTQRWVLAGMVFAAALAYGAGAFALGTAWPVAYARVLVAHQQAERFAAIQHTPAAIAFGFGMTPHSAVVTGLVAAAAAVVAALVICRAVADPFARFAACCALVPFVAAFYHEHDFIVAFVPAVWCAVRSRGALRAVGLLGTLLAAIDWFGLAQRPDGIAQSAALAVAAALGFVAIADRDEIDGHLAWAAALALVAFGAFSLLAIGHVAPIWPDALLAFHAPTHDTIAQVWHLEQQRSGLTARVRVWSLLRLMPLGGCVLLAVATAASATDRAAESAS